MRLINTKGMRFMPGVGREGEGSSFIFFRGSLLIFYSGMIMDFIIFHQKTMNFNKIKQKISWNL